MGKEYKYMINKGLAFSEEKMMKKLSDRAKEGWILEKVTLMWFKLKKREPQNLIYAVDCNKVKKSDEEYFEFFEKSGWTHVFTLDYLHFFSAKEGTVPIYTDKDQEGEKYESTRKWYTVALVSSVLAFIACIIISARYGSAMDNTMWFSVIAIVAFLSVMIAVPSLMVTVALYFSARKGKN